MSLFIISWVSCLRVVARNQLYECELKRAPLIANTMSSRYLILHFLEVPNKDPVDQTTSALQIFPPKTE